MKILLVRVSSLGDVLHNMPIVADLRHQFPGAQIDWVVEEGFAPLVGLHAGVQRIIPFALRRWRKSLSSATVRAEMRQFYQDLRQESYDLVLDTQGLLKTGLIMGLARTSTTGRKFGLANGTIGSGYEGISRLFHDLSVPVDPYTHAVLRGRLVAAHAGDYAVVGAPDFGVRNVELQPDWMPDSPYLTFFHGTAGAAKKWARAHWVATAAAFPDLPILLPWGNEAEHKEAQALAAAIPQAHVLPRLSLLEAVLLAQKARAVLGVDTGLTHIAAACGTPTVELYCASPKWKTEGNWSEKIINLGDAGSPPSPDAAIAALHSLFKPDTQRKSG